MVNPDSIPRYEQPTPAELEQMYGEPDHRDPDERMDECEHRVACMRLWDIFIGPLSGRPNDHAASTLDCGECLAYDQEYR